MALTFASGCVRGKTFSQAMCTPEQAVSLDRSTYARLVLPPLLDEET